VGFDGAGIAAGVLSGRTPLRTLGVLASRLAAWPSYAGRDAGFGPRSFSAVSTSAGKNDSIASSDSVKSTGVRS
jgi:hypothetical protein